MNRNPGFEESFVRAFVQKARRERALFELGSKKKRADFFWKLSRFESVLEGRYMQPIPPPNSDAQSIHDLLRSNGAPSICYLMSFNQRVDGQELPLLEALESSVGMGMPSVVCCLSGKLAYFEAEQEAGPPPRFLLKRKK